MQNSGTRWWDNHPAEKKAYKAEHYLRNKERLNCQSAEYQRTHRDQINARRREKMATDEHARIRHRLKERVANALKKKSGRKAAKTIELLGCEVNEFIIYIESRFQPGMTWENIELDHIVPCALFDLTKPEQQKACFHFSNYQPLFQFDNRSKGTRLNYTPRHVEK